LTLTAFVSSSRVDDHRGAEPQELLFATARRETLIEHAKRVTVVDASAKGPFEFWSQR
jgi:hypothetical protein